jgi:hypothetical protein
MKSILILLVLFSEFASSNDGIAGFKGGKVELNFSSNTNVSMKSEILKISQSLVNVDYVFYNDSKKNEDVLVAFPFPEVDCSDFQFDLDSKFTALVDGSPAPIKEEVIVKYKGKDITQTVKDAGLKLCRDTRFEQEMAENIRVNITNPEKYKFKKNCNEFIFYSNDKKFLDKFIQFCELGYVAEWSGENASVEYPWGPDWKVTKKMYFNASFPSMKETRIQHSYIPWQGRGSYFPKDLSYEKFEKIKNLKIWSQGLEKINKNPLRYEMILTSDRYSVEYILKTAKTWKGPIQDFKLILDRNNAAAISNYVKDYKVVGNDLVWESKNFIPKEDLVVSFLNYSFIERKFTGSVSEVERQEFASIGKEYNSLDLKNKESVNNLINRFKAYIKKYSKSKNLPQAFSMLDYLENDIN